MDHKIWCMKCRNHTKSDNPQIAKTSNGRPLLYAKCGQCNSGKTKFVSKKDFQEGQQGSGLLGNLLKLPGGKIPLLSDIPLLGMLF